MATTEIENPLHRLTDEQIEAIGREFDELHEQVRSDLGDRDARYIRGVIGLQRRLALLGRLLLIGSRFRPAWAAGTAVGEWGQSNQANAPAASSTKPVRRACVWPIGRTPSWST